MQTLDDEGAIRLIELRDEAIDVEEWPDASDLFRGMHRLIRPAELGSYLGSDLWTAAGLPAR